MKIIIIAISTIFLFAGCSSSKKGSDAEMMKKTESAKTMEKKADILNCTLNKDKRSLEIKTTTKGCELHYTKNGATKTTARSTKGMSHCKNARAKIKTTLENASFKCE